MALPALMGVDARKYRDFMLIYRQAKSVNGNSAGYQLVYPDIAAPGIPCNNHRTHNFSKLTSLAGMSKEVNLETANRVTFQYAVDVQDLDILFITSRWGDTDWQAVQGAPERGSLIQHGFVYTVPTNAPDITEAE